MGRRASTSHPVFLNNPGIVQTQEEMGHLPGSVALQEMKIKSLGRKLWFIPIQKTTKYYYNQVFRKFPKSHQYVSLLLIIQRLGNCSNPERKQLQMLQCTYFIPLSVILQLLLKFFPLLSFISKAAEQLAHS